MAVPKKKTSKSITRRRHTAFQKRTREKLDKITNLTKCDRCKMKKLSHAVCLNCGFYKGEDILKLEEKDKKKEKRIKKIKA